MPILPVLDLLQGHIVRGIAGQRDIYKPIISRLVSSSEPLAVAEALQQHFGFTEFYLADLDAIQHGQPNLAVMTQLQHAGFRLWIDAGLQSAHDETLTALLALNPAGIVVGLESVAGPEELRRIGQRAGERVIFSLDLKAGKPLGRVALWDAVDAENIARQALALLPSPRLLVLDLARVGVGGGAGTEELCLRIKRAFPAVQLTAGGGVRGIDDVRRLYAHGVDYVLVASALHDGRLTPAEVRQC